MVKSQDEIEGTPDKKGTIHPSEARYHTGKRILLLKNTDHGLIFRVEPSGDIVVELNIGKDKKTGVPTNGGIVLTTVATNIFKQEFMDMVSNQIKGLSSVQKND